MKQFLTGLILLFLGYQALAQEFVQYRYENGVVSSEGIMRNGKPDGYWKTFYPDGGLKTEGNRKDFLLDSTWRFYRGDSTLERIITYQADIKTGPEKVYDKKGNLVEEFNNRNNIREGEARYYYDTGELWKTINFQNNREEGKGTEYEKDGRIITRLTYKNGFIYADERINRFNSQGKRTGMWVDLYPNGLTKEEGTWSNGLRNGVFKFFSKKGDLEKLEKYEDGVLVIDEAATAILDMRQEFYDDGRVKSAGPYREGKKQGNFREYDTAGREVGGALYDADVRVGEGMIDSLGLRVGKWKLYYNDGTLRAEGEYIEGLKEGPWNYYYTDGKPEQKGSYKGDQPTGEWRWFFANGSLHRDEYYRKGKEDGHAIEYDTLDVIINEGDYVDGAKRGPWKLTVNDHTEEGEYLDGERNGPWTWRYGNGEKAFQGDFESGIPTGKHKYWYPEGQLRMVGEYAGGELDGRWDYYDELGTLILQIDYEAGQAVRINGQKIKLPNRGEEDN